MAKIIVGADGVVSLRLDNAYVSNGKYLVTPYEAEDGKKRYFGNFKFTDMKEAEKTLKEAVKKTKLGDTVFYGQYPKWATDEYGTSLACGNRVKFYRSINSKELVPEDEIDQYLYSLEIHLKKTKEQEIFLAVARAVVTGENANAYNDDLFDDFIEESDKEDGKDTQDTEEKTVTQEDISEDDLPF